MSERIKATDGMLYYIAKRIRPELAKRIAETGKLETIVIGLGGQGTKHAGLMMDFGTDVVAGIAPTRGGSRIHETIPVYDTVKDCLEEHPNIVATSIWRHYSTAKDATIEAIESGIPLVVLITEGIPLRDVRDILVSARKHNTLLIGGNTPGLIFPPEGIKIGMLPDVFYPEEPVDGKFGSHGVTIISRSGAILYHMSDALASVGIAQNAVIGVGGDGAIGSTFKELVPLAMGYENTDLVVMAGEIGGSQEELFAEYVKTNPGILTKPLVAVLSGAHAPEGKRMGHAGAIVTPGLETGTFKSKKTALESVGIIVVNSQFDLIDVVKKKLGGKTYFKPERYYDKMRKIWDAPPPKPSWGTMVTKVEPNNLVIQGYKLKELVEYSNLMEVAHLLIKGNLPDADTVKFHAALAVKAAQIPVPKVPHVDGEDISKTIEKYLMLDEELANFHVEGRKAQVGKIIFCLGRIAAYLANILGNKSVLYKLTADEPFSYAIFRVVTGKKKVDIGQARMLEAMIVASVDHGVTPPSAQATVIAASVRAPYEVAIAHGVGAITDVHGGAGQKAAVFFKQAAEMASSSHISLEEATHELMGEYMRKGYRIEGMGHRVHTEDPRRDVLWSLAEKNRLAGPCVVISKIATKILEDVRGINLPINVDGVIGAIVADMGLDPSLAKALFIYGRVAGLSAHYFEEVSSQQQMRRINFAEAVYKGPAERKYPV